MGIDIRRVLRILRIKKSQSGVWVGNKPIKAGGPAIEAACRQLRGCPTGEARVTTGGNLKARYVIHTVGPVYQDGCHREPELLASCYRESLKLASEKGIKSLAFPSISTGIYGYPIEDAAQIALKTVTDYLARLNGDKVSNLYALVLSEIERPLIQAVLEQCGHNQSKAAQMLGLSRSTLRKKMAGLGLH